MKIINIILFICFKNIYIYIYRAERFFSLFKTLKFAIISGLEYCNMLFILFIN